MSADILVIEDDAKTAETVRLYLEHDGHVVEACGDGAEGLARAESGSYDLVVLDLMLPTIDGSEVCRRLRAGSDLPVIMLTARTTEPERVRGLDLGADDYVTKPFSPRELVARVRAVLRRAASSNGAREAGDTLRRGDLRIDMPARRVFVAGDEVALTPTEFDLLRTLAQRPGRVFSREELIEAVLGRDFAGIDRTIDAHVMNLRKKVEADRSRPRYVQTVFGAGYRFATPEAEGG